MARYTVRDAAEMLGITTGAVRNRLSRGTLQSVKDGGTVYELLPERDAERDATDTPGVLVDELRDRVRSLEGQLAEERESRRRADTILAQLAQANAEMSRTIRAIEAPSEAATTQAPSEPPGAPTEATEQPGRGEPQAPLEAAQEGALRPDSEASEAPRPWWRRVFG